ncbi:hypothetical protein H6P81_011846 [Aristolochia fimbriata]|uniref:Response regulatory domain-containing protein n=1 Tax=Aristolochia fimbriata TaxID=158543 RepID=A0AAV7EA97_ARIFI|nr:hypothetical protein H6P81_011846 [Aristolochia fimbriata]
MPTLPHQVDDQRATTITFVVLKVSQGERESSNNPLSSWGSKGYKEVEINTNTMMKSTDNSTREGFEAPGNLRNELSALVVDDNKVTRKILMTMLKWAKIKAQEVENGKEAIDLFASGANFHLIFIDMQMPIMDGPEATRILRSMGVRSRIVGVSANCRENDKAEFMGAGLDEFYVKPLSCKNETIQQESSFPPSVSSSPGVFLPKMFCLSFNGAVSRIQRPVPSSRVSDCNIFKTKTEPAKHCVSPSIPQQKVREQHEGELMAVRDNETKHPGHFFSSKRPAIPGQSAPLVTALKVSAEKTSACFHFPGHNRGQAAPQMLTELIGLRPFVHDLPELPELDDLFSPKGVILEAQNLASQLFGASQTWFLVGGTTCGIQAAIMATCSPGDSLILSRNSHISAMSGLVLSGAIPEYIIPEYNSQWDIFCGITYSQVEKSIKKLKMEGRRIGAVLVTSPTYHGLCSNVMPISELCHSHGIPVIADEAHGAHFKFHHLMPSSCLEQGADIAVQSTHKVLSSLTQSSMLHVSGDIVDREKISRCLQTLQSTSPSYLLLASLDAARAQLSELPITIFGRSMDLASEARHLIRNIVNVSLMDPLNFSNSPLIDPLRITISTWELGISGYEADKMLCEEHNVIAEVAGTRSLTFAINLGTSREHIQILVSGLEKLSEKSQVNGWKKCMKNTVYSPHADISMTLSPRDAFFAGKRKVSIKESIGEVCGELISSYPPGIPVLIPGENITKGAIDYLLDVRNEGAEISGAADTNLASIVVCT